MRVVILAVVWRVALSLVKNSLRDLSRGHAVTINLQLIIILVFGVPDLRALVHDYPRKLRIISRRHTLEKHQGMLLVLQTLRQHI